MTGVSYREDGPVARLVLDRPEAVNALNDEMRTGLIQGLQRAERSEAIRVVVLIGEGERGFCAGADIKEFKPTTSLEAAERRQREPTWSDLMGYSVSKPIVCGLHGYCLGGGLELALAADIRIASDNARLGLPEVTRAVIPGAGGTQRLVRIVGVGLASYLILTGSIISATEALACGLVSRVVPLAKLDATVDECAQMIAANAPMAVQHARAAIRYGQEVPLRAGLAMEGRLSELLLFSADRAEAVDAFSNKRAARFSGG